MTMDLANLNFRDLGGIRTNGGAVRGGALFRAEGPANLLPQHHAQLKSLGIGYIFDLRSKRERETHPHDWQEANCRWLGLDVNADLRVFGNDGRERLSLGADERLAIDIMSETYREIPDALAPHWKTIGECLLEGRPAIVNCTAGKDRTGVAVAILLEMLGASRDEIIRDYHRSVVFGENLRRGGTLEGDIQAAFGFLPSAEQVDALIGVRTEYLQAAWERIENSHKTVSRYLADSGLDEAIQSELRHLFLTCDHANTIQGEQ